MKNPFALSACSTEALTKARQCLSCGKYIRKGEVVLVVRWSDKFGKKTSALCDESCWRDYDDAFWQNRADNNETNQMFDEVFENNYSTV